MKLVLALLLLFLIPATAFAHTEEQIEEWEEEWGKVFWMVVESGGTDGVWGSVYLDLLGEREEFMDRHPCYYYDTGCYVPAPVEPKTTTHTQPSVHRGMGSNVEQWRGLVARHFSNVEKALCVIRYESGGNPDARNPSGAAGLFQVMPFWFDHFGGDAYEPENNARVAALVLAEQGWTAWSVVNKGKC